MPRTPKGKVFIGIYIDEHVNRRLRKYISEAYKEYEKGLLSKVIQDAIISYLDLRRIEGNIQQHTRSKSNESNGETLDKYVDVNPGTPQTLMECNKIIERIKREGYTHQIDIYTLKYYIGRYRGRDPRTLRKWIKRLVENGFLKQLENKVVFEILK